MMPGQSQGPPSFLDAANTLLAPCEARLETGTIAPGGNGGQLGVLTIRTASTTLTVLLGPQDIRNWAKLLTALGDSMSGSGLIVAQGTVLPEIQ